MHNRTLMFGFMVSMGAILLFLQDLKAASKTYNFGDRKSIQAIASVSGDASGDKTAVQATAEATVDIQIARKRFEAMSISSSAHANLNNGGINIQGQVFGKSRTFVDKSYSTDVEKDFPYYSKSKDLPKVRFLVGGIPCFLKPSVYLKLDGNLSLVLNSVDGGGTADFQFQPIVGKGIAQLDAALGVEGINAGARGKVTVITVGSSLEASLFVEENGSGKGSYEVYGYLKGPEGKISLFAKVVKKEVEKELWKFNATAKKNFVLKNESYSFGARQPNMEDIAGRWNVLWSEDVSNNGAGSSYNEVMVFNLDGTYYTEPEGVSSGVGTWGVSNGQFYWTNKFYTAISYRGPVEFSGSAVSRIVVSAGGPWTGVLTR